MTTNLVTGSGADDEAWLSELLASIPFLSHLGVELVQCGGGEAVLRLDVQANHLNGCGVAHGGLLMTLLDSAMGLAARNPSPGISPGMATVQMSSQFIQGAAGRLVTNARVVYHSFALIFCEAAVVDDHANLCAQGIAAFKRLSIAPLKPAA
ncbi:MAG: PaaI family thioesterase [Paraburkholderia sp.]|uniref:PaaI family thioesterase n=1 Tax=Paraburkholderia sp. TaxID=1926495 RepID=UPI00121FFFFE|nr:PaaI family thioesterase [Paraburkholderia sp.]TAM03726.1 MAG: PaaI family thioesterase [Paraburkholderia sp.]